jgi:hypothetical protein
LYIGLIVFFKNFIAKTTSYQRVFRVGCRIGGLIQKKRIPWNGYPAGNRKNSAVNRIRDAGDFDSALNLQKNPDMI